MNESSSRIIVFSSFHTHVPTFITICIQMVFIWCVFGYNSPTVCLCVRAFNVHNKTLLKAFLFLNVSKMINLHVQALSILRRRWCNRGRWFFTAAAMHIQSNVYTGIYLFIVWNFTLECKSQWTHYLHKLTFNIAKHWKRVFILFMISLLRHRSRYIN